MFQYASGSFIKWYKSQYKTIWTFYLFAKYYSLFKIRFKIDENVWITGYIGGTFAFEALKKVTKFILIFIQLILSQDSFKKI